MKKIVSLLLCMVMIFSFAMPSFAQTADGQSTSLQSGWGSGTSNSYPTGYYNSWFYRVLTWFDYLNDNILSINSRLTSWDTDINSITIISDAFKMLDTGWYSNSNSYPTSAAGSWFSFVSSKLYTSDESLYSISSGVSALVPDVDTINLYLTNTLNAHLNDISGYLSLMKDDVSMLQQVLADEEDLAFKESQKENQQYVQDTFFSSSSDLSLNLDDFGILTQYVREFKTGYNFEENIGNPLPLTLINTESDFKDWFSDSTGQAMDPTFNGGSGGGGGEDPDPDPDPEPTIKNWLPLATTEPGGSEIYNGKGWKENTRWSYSSQAPSTSSAYVTMLSGWIPVSFSDIVYLYNVTFTGNSQEGLIIFYNGTGYPKYFSQFPIHDVDGVFSLDISSFDSPEDVSFFRVCVGSFSSDSIISINQYPIQTASTFSLRSVFSEPEIVTSYYADRLAEVERIKGGNK